MSRDKDVLVDIILESGKRMSLFTRFPLGVILCLELIFRGLV